MKRIVDWFAQGRRMVRENVRLLSLFLVAALLVLVVIGIRVGTAPQRQITAAHDLTEYGRAGVSIQVIYPAFLTAGSPLAQAVPITVIAKASDAAGVAELLLTLERPGELVAFVDTSGEHVAGRVNITPGYPDPAYADILVMHGNVQAHRRLLGTETVMITPMIWAEGQPVPLPEIAFPIRLQSPSVAFVRRGVVMLVTAGLPLLALLGVLVLGAWGWRQQWRRRTMRRDKQLSAVYLMLREHIKLEQWQDARQAIDQLRLAQSRYRDLDHLDTLVSAAETASWRRDQLYQAGIESYKDRDWPNAVQAFHTIESETPYYRDVRFLRRTAALYADLASRDRSLRLAAASELGQVADLVDRVPLLNALGDHSVQVADAAERAFGQIGADSFDTLLQGLVHPSADVRRRSYGLLQSMGQDVRDSLLNALHSQDPLLTTWVAKLLANLGAREDLAQSLLWAQPSHHKGIVQALCTESLGSGAVLVQTLLDAPENKLDGLLAALAALKAVDPVDRRLEEALRATRDPEAKRRLRLAMSASVDAFHAKEPVHFEPASSAVSSEVEEADDAPPRRGPRLRLLGGGRS